MFMIFLLDFPKLDRATGHMDYHPTIHLFTIALSLLENIYYEIGFKAF